MLYSGVLFGFMYASKIMRWSMCVYGAEANAGDEGITALCKGDVRYWSVRVDLVATSSPTGAYSLAPITNAFDDAIAGARQTQRPIALRSELSPNALELRLHLLGELACLRLVSRLVLPSIARMQKVVRHIGHSVGHFQSEDGVGVIRDAL